MKKALLVVLLLIFAIMGGCQTAGQGGTEDTPAGGSPAQGSATEAAQQADTGGEPVTLEFWNMFTGGDGEFMLNMINNFMEAYPHITINHLSMPEADYYTRLPAAIAVNDAPDIAIVHSSRLADIMRMNNALLPLNDFGINWNMFPDSLVESAIFDGNNIAIPLDIHPIVMFYNREHLGPAGLLRDDGSIDFDTGLDNFRDLLLRFQAANTNPDVMPFAFTNITSNFPTWVWWVLYNQQGGEFLTPDGTAAAFDNAEALRALQIMYDFVYADGVVPEGIRSSQEQFVAGNAAVSWSGVWTVGMILESGIDVGIMPIPHLLDRHVVWGDSHTFVIPQQTSPEKYDAAVQFAYWIARNSLEWANAGHIPAYTGVSDSEAFQALPLRSGYVESRDLIAFYPQNENILAMITAIRAEIELMLTGQATPEQTLAGMVEGVNAALN